MSQPAGGENLDTTSLARKLSSIIASSWVSQATYVAAELQIADHLANGPRTSEELASLTGTHAPSLRRLLRALVSIEICREREDGSFELTPMGSLLRTDAPVSLCAWARWWGTRLLPDWGQLLYSVRTGKSARALLTGTAGFQHLERDPAAAAIFHQAMIALTRLACESIVRSYDFSGLQRIMDVGGGYGELLSAILRAYPTATGVLFDQPHAIAGARQHFEKTNLLHRCELVEGDFFQAVPPGADAYLLKSVLHDWDYAHSKQILDNCRTAMAKGARLLLLEQMLPKRWEATESHQSLARIDLTMLVAHAAGERTEEEFRELLHAADFDIARIVPAGPTMCILEAFPGS